MRSRGLDIFLLTAHDVASGLAKPTEDELRAMDGPSLLDHAEAVLICAGAGYSLGPSRFALPDGHPAAPVYYLLRACPVSADVDVPQRVLSAATGREWRRVRSSRPARRREREKAVGA